MVISMIIEMIVEITVEMIVEIVQTDLVMNTRSRAGWRRR